MCLPSLLLVTNLFPRHLDSRKTASWIAAWGAPESLQKPMDETLSVARRPPRGSGGEEVSPQSLVLAHYSRWIQTLQSRDRSASASSWSLPWRSRKCGEEWTTQGEWKEEASPPWVFAPLDTRTETQACGVVGPPVGQGKGEGAVCHARL